MSRKSIVDKLQSLTGASKHEVTAAGIILFGLLLGTIVKITGSSEKALPAGDIYRSLDSIADMQKTTYTGTDIHGNPIGSLASGDTLLAKDRMFPAPSKKSLPDGIININTSSRAQLMKLPGVGEVTANKIIEYRSEHPFIKIEDIKKVKGIGPKKLEKMRDYITTGKSIQNTPDKNKEKDSKPQESKKASKSRININTAPAGLLQELPGIGPATAEKIINYRRNNTFKKPSDIKKVKGIGPKKFEKIAPFIVVK